MKKYGVLVSVVLVVVSIVGLLLFARQAKLECAIKLVRSATAYDHMCSPFDDPYYQGNAPIGGEPNAGANTSRTDEMLEKIDPIMSSFISVKDFTTGEELNREEPIELEAGHEYQIIYAFPSRTEGFNFDTAVFRIISDLRNIPAGSERSVTAVMSDGAMVLGDYITFSSSDGSLQLLDGHAPYTIYRERSSRGLFSEHVCCRDGFMLRADTIDHGAPQYITYTFHVVECDSEQDSSTESGAGPMNPNPYCLSKPKRA